MVVGDIDRAGRGLPEQACAEIEMVSGPFVLHHDEALAETGAHIAKSGFETPHGLVPREPVGDGDDDRPGHGEPLSMLATSAVMWCGASRTASSAEGCLALRGVVLLVDMAEIAGRRDLISHHLLQLLDLGKAPVLAARPQQLAVDPDLEHPARVVGNERHGPELLGEGREQLLTHPGGAQQPITEPAIGNGDVRSWLDGGTPCRGWE